MVCACSSFHLYAQEVPYSYVFFDNSIMSKNYYYSEAVYTSPSWIKNSNNKLPVNDSVFFTPGNSLELTYVSAAKGNWQAKILYHPVRGRDIFKPASNLIFRLYVKSNTNEAQLPAIAIGKKESKQLSAFLPLQSFIDNYKTNSWLTVKIPLKNFKEINYKELEEIDVVAFTQQIADGLEHHLYIDQLEFCPDTSVQKISCVPEIIKAKGYEKHVDITWEKITDTAVQYVKIYRSLDQKYFYPVAIESPINSRYSDFVDITGKTFYYKISLIDADYNETSLSNLVSAETHSMIDEELLTMVQEANFRYYWDGAEPNSGLALEDIPGRKTMIATGASGFGILALLTGIERKFIAREEGVERFIRIISFLDKAEKFHGAFPHFINGETGKVVPFFGQNDNGGDLVETAFLAQGLITARAFFSGDNEKEKFIRDKITSIWNGIEWDWYRKRPDTNYLTWHWSPDKEWKINHQLIGWNETMIVYLLAIISPTHSIPASIYYTGWASQEKKAQDYRKAWGGTADGSMYTNGNTYFGIPLKVGVSNGGPLFFAHYSFLAADPKAIKDKYTDYFTNNKNIALINYRYCVENPGKHKGYREAGWGLTASDGMWGYSADEPNANNDHGKITPTGALSSFPYTPVESMQALKNYYRNCGKFLWGAYGFRDSYNLDENWCSSLYMGLNQATITVMIENYRTGLLWKLFMSDPEVKAGFKKLGF